MTKTSMVSTETDIMMLQSVWTITSNI